MSYFTLDRDMGQLNPGEFQANSIKTWCLQLSWGFVEGIRKKFWIHWRQWQLHIISKT